MKRKAQGLSMNVIIIAALALIVLVVLSIIFVGKAGDFRKRSDQCENSGGTCIDNEPGACEGDFERKIAGVCFDAQGEVDPDKICCVST